MQQKLNFGTGMTGSNNGIYPLLFACHIHPSLFGTMRVYTVTYLSCLLFLSCFSGLIWANEAAKEPETGFFDKLMKLAKGGGTEELIPMPKCLLTLSGGIDQVETEIQDYLEKGKALTILITAKTDPTSLPAVKSYYDAVRQICGEEEPQTGEEGAVQQSAFDDHLPQESYVFDPSVLDRMAFAHMSFDSETGMMWRWWIWKVPAIVFVTSPTSSLRSYDVRFWKIAFSIPSTEKLIAIIKDQIWTDLPVWDSDFAPGGKYQQVSRFFSQGSLGFMSVLDPIPNWLLGVLASTLASMLIGYLHRNDGKAAQQQAKSGGPENRKTQ